MIKKELVDSLFTEFGEPDITGLSIREVGKLVSQIEEQSGVEFIHMEMGIPGLPASAIAIAAEKEALDKGDAMPTDYLGFSFHAYETFPMHTNHLSNKEVLKFRDDAFLTYHTNPKFLIRIKEKFGQAAVDNILQMTKIKLQRQLHDK